MRKDKPQTSNNSNDSFKSAQTSVTVVPSVGSDRTSKTVTGETAESFHSINKATGTANVIIPVNIKKRGAKSNTINPDSHVGYVGKVIKSHALKKVKSVGNNPDDIGKFVTTAEKKKTVGIVTPLEKTNHIAKCNHLSMGIPIAENANYHSDHNPVAVYIPGLFAGTKNAYVITYNEKGNTPNAETLYDSFIKTLNYLTDVDMIFIGIQEGDAYKTFIKTILKCIEDKKHVNSELPKTAVFKSADNITIADKVLNNPETKLTNWKLTTNTYESTGKECLKKWKGVCLVNGCYALLKNGCGLTVEDIGKDIIMKGGILNTTKHCAWAVVKEERTGIKHVFVSCHLEYSGKYNPENGDLLGYDARKQQLTAYINMLYKKYEGVSRFIFCGDTNMRILSSAMYEYESKKKYILDQMLYYLMQCDNSKQMVKSIDAIKKYAGLGDVSMYENEAGSKRVLDNNKFWNCVGCDISFGRKMLLYRLGGVNTFCSYLTGKVGNTPKCNDLTESLLGKYIVAKFNEVDKYVESNKDGDKFAGYCMNPEFVVGDNKFRAYDFSYKDLTSKCMMKTIWDVYNYKPTAIFTLDGPNRTFDYDKRVKSGNILAPAVVDRVFMFEPHKHYVSIDNTKVGFVKYRRV